MDLLSAVRAGNIQATEQALKDGGSPNIRDEEGNVPLLLAVEQKKLSLVQLLLQYGADPVSECATPDRSSPFSFALYTEDILMLETFIKHGVDLNQTLPKENAPALILAVDLGSSRLVNLFLSYGADVNHICAGITPLIKAIENKHIGITRTLLEHGAKVKEKNVDVTPLATALMTNDSDIVRITLQYAQREGININNTFGGFAIAPLLLSAKFGLANSTRVLLEAGCDANVTTQYGETALHFAVQGYSNTAVIAILLEAGCNPFIADLQTGKGNTALHLACHLGNLAAVKMLYSHMVNMWNKDERIQSGSKHKRTSFSSIGEDPEHTASGPSSHFSSSGSGSLPSYHTALNKRSNQYGGVGSMKSQQPSQVSGQPSQAMPSILAYCQAADSVLSLPNEQWHTPVGKTLLSGKLQVLEYFISIVQHIRLYLPASTSKAVSEVDLLLHRAVSSGQLEVVKFLLEIGYDINKPDETKSCATPLIAAARQAYTNINMCQFLVDHGAQLNAVDKNHETALSTAVYFGFEKNAALLIQHGADLNLPDARSTTPLYWAIFNARIPTLQLLIHAGAKFTHEQLRLTPKNLKVTRDPHLSAWMLEQISNPRSLQLTCILMLRRHLAELSAGRTILPRISLLPLPKSLQSMLTFE
ncbi:uncharacterized protein LOC106153847 [Lingula anatina]|uniref:Uncharacterized protein LOC106153847 n=1 Tax=Lingula anatina TaxID=7574 RepID=A0A1S3HBL8_LINAN|nr:uncharacterized protein LOC106153847 [Lingula anatina]|eukprot:XP_013383410.1 uncharacterized protein LOC106153847 [Lingula anatina]